MGLLKRSGRRSTPEFDQTSAVCEHCRRKMEHSLIQLVTRNDKGYWGQLAHLCSACKASLGATSYEPELPNY